MPTRKSPLALLAGLATLLILPATAVADSDRGGGPDENRDVATPGAVPADSRPLAAAEEAATADLGVTIFAAAAQRNPIDDFRYDGLVLEGTAAQVCAGRLLPGAGWTFNEITSRFGGTAGTMYFCRERWDTATDPACNGQQANPVTTPTFHSTCWSNHARGRAIDIMVGGLGGGYNTNRGIAIVNWLLARDAQGNVNSNARKLGVQQILFADRCWNSDGDRGIASWHAMRQCGIGHHDHVHLDMTVNGANGNVSYWGRTPVVTPKIDTQMFWDQNTAWRQAISWWNLIPNDEEGLAVPSQYDQIAVGDLDGDGVQDETFLWDRQTGNWAIQNWTNGDSLTARIGTWTRVYDRIHMADLDSDGRVDDMFLWDLDSGNYAVVAWSRNFGNVVRARGRLAGFDAVYPADLDGNGRVNDFLIWDRETGTLVASTWAGFRMRHLVVSRFPGRGYDDIVVGDWSAGGDLDETLLWDRNTGRWTLYSWAGFRPTFQRSGAWSAAIDIAAPGDYDTDGRVDDLFIYDIGTGKWAVWSWHRNVPSQRTSSTWARGFDVITVGSFMD